MMHNIQGHPIFSASIIWLHGLGADGHDFEPVVKMLNLPYIHFILPHAPYMPVTLNNGYEMRAWYDIYSLNKNGPQDQLGMERARQSIEALIAEEIQRGIPSDRIALAGFSQGGAVALHTALRFPTPLAGVMALSTYMPSADRLAAEKHTANQHSPILMAHGDFDEVITPETAMYARDILRTEGYAVEWHTYEMAHSVTPQEIDDIRQFIQKILPE